MQRPVSGRSERSFSTVRQFDVWRVGLAWGIIVWSVMSSIVLPMSGAQALADGAPKAITIANHLVFGLALGLVCAAFQRRPEARASHTNRGPAAVSAMKNGDKSFSV